MVSQKKKTEIPTEIIDICSKFHENTKKDLGFGGDPIFIVNNNSSSSNVVRFHFVKNNIISQHCMESGRSLKINISDACRPILMKKNFFFLLRIGKHWGKRFASLSFLTLVICQMEKSLETDLIITKNQTFTKDFHRRQRIHSTRHHNVSSNKTRSSLDQQTTADDDAGIMYTNNDKPNLRHMNSQASAALFHNLSRQNYIIKKKSSIMKRTPADDLLSKNISFLLENLLKRYENSHLPTHGQGVPTIVKTNILIRSMGPVSEQDMDYSMDCYFRQYWRDTRLKFEGPMKSLSLSIKMLERIWRPDTYFYNGKHSHIHTITVPNKLLRLTQDGDILYSMRLTIKASCPMELRNFPMDRQSCPLILGSYAYTSKSLVYEWQSSDSVTFTPGMTLSQFDLISIPQKNYTYNRREGDFSVLQVSFNMQRLSGYFLIQVYVPCILIVVLSWVSFWIHREATSDRVGLGITTVLTLSTISLDSRTDLPKVRYATALDWFLLMSFFYCIATLLEFAGVHYFTKVGSGEIPEITEDEWEDIGETTELVGGDLYLTSSTSNSPQRNMAIVRPRGSMICPIYSDPGIFFKSTQSQSHTSTMERTTQTEPPKAPKWKQIWLCFLGDDKFRKQRQREATEKCVGTSRYVNSVSLIDRTARIGFPMSFTILNILYWLVYVTFQEDFPYVPNNDIKN